MNKSKTVLWVLGWIFIFPLPLMILLNRRNDLNPTLKYGVIGGAWAVYLAIGIVGMMNRDPSKLSDKATVQSKVVEEKPDATTAYVPENIMEKEIKTEVPKDTEKVTEKVTEKTTEKVTEMITEKVTEKITEEVTEKQSENSTEAVTEKVTEAETETVTEIVTEAETEAEPVYEYVLNVNSGVFHLEGCRHEKKMKSKNKKYISATYSQMISWGYNPCDTCILGY